MATKIPIVLTRFIGRQEEIGGIRQLLAGARLVTLTGPGGGGKTRLAVAVADQVKDQYEGGLIWVDLAPIADESLVSQAVAKAANVKEQPGHPVWETLVDFFGGKQRLLIMDNCEHLLAACHHLITILLAETPISILTTSREPMSVTGERLYHVPPMSLPPRGYPVDDLAGMKQFEATQLFVVRAQAILPAFDITADNVNAVVKICRQLDGLPLAIELAAARVNVLAAEQIAARLENQFALLAPAEHITYSSHQTLRAAIDWSYDLLNTSEQLLLRRLSVFAGGCSLTTAETVCIGDGIEREQVLNLLASLVNKSLFTAVTLYLNEARYSMLETIRQYGQEKLQASGEAATINDRHLQCFLRLTEDTEPKLSGEYQQLWLSWLEDEYGNIRTALNWALSSGQVEAGLRIAIAIYQFWTIRDYVEEGLDWLERLLAEDLDGLAAAIHANALFYAMNMAGFRGNRDAQMVYGRRAAALGESLEETDRQALRWVLAAKANEARIAGDNQTAFAYAKQAIQIARELGNTYQLGISLSLWSFVAMSLGEYDEAREMQDEALPILREMGNPYRLAMALNYSGDLARCQEKFTQAQSAYEESVSLLRSIEAVRDLASVLHNLGHACLRLGDAGRAAVLFQESMELQREQGNEPGITECLLGFAALAVADQMPASGARLLAAAAAIGGQKITSEWAATSMTYSYYLERARASLSEAAFYSEQAAGQRMTLEQAVFVAEDVARRAAASQITRRPADQLTPREREVATLIAQGKSNDQIAAELVVSKRTVEKHIAHIRSKLDFAERTQIARWVIEKGLIDSSM